MRIFSLVGFFAFLSCATSSPWWEEPPQIEGKITAVGQAIFTGNEVIAKRAAEANARQVLAAFVKTQIQSLTETWGKQAGDDRVASRVSQYFNDENITRELINTTLRGARPLRYKRHGKYMYVLMAIDTENFAKYWKEVASKAMEEDRALQALLESQAMKEDYARRMDRLIQEYLSRVASGLRAFRK